MTPVDIGELRSLRTELLEAHREVSRLRMQNEQLVASNRDLSSQLTAASQSGGELLRTIVAFRQLLEGSDAAATLQSIADILINVVGTEDFVVLNVSDTAALRPVAGMGPALDRARSTAPTMAALAAGATRVVPLLINEHVVGVIAIESLLPHREGLSLADERVLDLLSSFAATAIASAEHRRHWTRLPLAEVA